MACNAERGLERLEAACAQKTFAQDQEAPAVADYRNRAGDRALLLFKGGPFHQRLQRPATPSPANSNSELMRIQRGVGPFIEKSRAPCLQFYKSTINLR